MLPELNTQFKGRMSLLSSFRQCLCQPLVAKESLAKFLESKDDRLKLAARADKGERSTLPVSSR
jgi:hypothetical protein